MHHRRARQTQRPAREQCVGSIKAHTRKSGAGVEKDDRRIGGSWGSLRHLLSHPSDFLVTLTMNPKAAGALFYTLNDLVKLQSDSHFIVAIENEPREFETRLKAG
jgi:hypothetical protein